MAVKAIKAGMATGPDARMGMLPKAPTGISGLDEVTGGGLPRGRPTLVCGPAGCGKTLLAMEFLVRGITEFDEPGVFVAFEESAEDLIANVASFGFDLAQFEADGRMVIDHVELVGSEMEEAGEWDLDGLFLRLGAAIDEVGAKRVVIDTIETMFGVFSNTAVLRCELRRLFGWLKERGVTAVITAERGDGTLTRYGIEEYVSDCVIVLDHRVSEQASTRRLRILKYRGSLHGTNEYPFLIGESGMSVLPITAHGLQHGVSTERVSTGVARLDAMLGDGGFYKGGTVLVSGTAGTGKSTLAAQFCDAACKRGERAMYFAFEESEAEIIRNMRSVGIDLRRWVDAGLLRFHCFRPTLLGLEGHLFAMQKHRPRVRPCRDRQGPDLRPRARGERSRRVPDADASGRLPEGQRGDGAVHQPRLRGGDGPGGPADRFARRHVAAGQDDGGQRRTQPRPVRAQGARDGELQPDPRVSAHQPGDRVGRRVRRPAGRAHRLGPPGPGGPGGRRRDGTDGGPRAAPDQPRTPTRGRRGADRVAVARVRGRSRQRGPPAQPRLDRRRGSRRPTRRAGPAARRRHRSAGAFRPPDAIVVGAS